MSAPPPTPRRPAGPRAAPVLLGAFFLLLAGAAAWYALRREPAAPLSVRVRVLDLAGAPLAGTEVRTRYGGAWVRVSADGAALLEAPRLREGAADPAAALAEALEARAPYHALRRERRATVSLGSDGVYEARFRLERCGLLRVGVALSGYPEARATLDADPLRERWRLLEGHDVVRAGQASTWAVFEGAERLWMTLEGDQGMAQERVWYAAPGPGFLLEKTLFPHAARPLSGRVALRSASAPSAATLAGVLDVTELPEGEDPVPRLPVRIEPDGSFRVDYTGEGRFRLEARCPFLAQAQAVGASGGDQDVRIEADPRPWIEVGPAELGRLDPPPVVSLFPRGGGESVLPLLGVTSTERGLQVATPGPGRHTLSIVTRASDRAPPRSGEVEVEVPSAGPVATQVALHDLPHGTLVVHLPQIPERGGQVRVLPDRERTVLPRGSDTASFAHVPVGTTYVSVRWQDPERAREFLVAQVRAGETVEVTASLGRGGRVRFEVAGTALEGDARPYALYLSAGRTPYGPAEGSVSLVRRLVDGVPFLSPEGALRPGAYRAALHVTEPGGPPARDVSFDVRAGEETSVRVDTP